MKRIVFGSFLLCSLLLSNGYADNLCSGKNATLECLSKNFQKLYSSDLKQFWKILHEAEKKALACKSTSETAKFMSLVRIENINTEFDEFFRETIENICAKNSKCFFEAVSSMPAADQSKIVNLLLESTFVDQTDITKVFKKYKSVKKYKSIVDMYLKKAEAK